MTLEMAFNDLKEKLQRLEEAAGSLVWAAVEARPDGKFVHAVAEHYDGAAQALAGLVQEARVAAEQAFEAANEQPDIAHVRKWLTVCQAQFNKTRDNFYNDLFSFEWRNGLNQLAQERKEWAGYCAGVKDALALCPPLLFEANEALFRCWQELTARTEHFSVSNSTAVSGPKIHITQS